MLQLLIPLPLFLPFPAPQDGWPKPDERVACGPLAFEVHVSRTAHVFHLVDQLSAWDNACHGQYREHMELSPEDEEHLKRFAEVRSKRRWGQGLEQTFYVPLELDAAIRAGKKAGNVTQAEADVIRPVLEHFASRAEALLESKRALLERAFAGIDRERMTRAAESLARFTGTKKLVVPTFPLASPAPGGGGMDGGRLKWELDSDRVPFSVLLHETTHAFFLEKNELLARTVAETPGLTMTLLGEGFAYAMAPGLYSDGGSDELLGNVAQDRARDQAWNDPTYGRQREYALALRPLFGEALETSTLEAFLQRARDVFLAIQEVESARPGRGGPPKLAIAGPASDAVRERLGSKYSLWIHSFNHASDGYAETVPKLGQGDLLVLLVARDDSERIPAEQGKICPLPLDELEKRLAKGEALEKEGAWNSARVVLLAAPTTKALEELVRSSALLEP